MFGRIFCFFALFTSLASAQPRLHLTHLYATCAGKGESVVLHVEVKNLGNQRSSAWELRVLCRPQAATRLKSPGRQPSLERPFDGPLDPRPADDWARVLQGSPIAAGGRDIFEFTTPYHGSEAFKEADLLGFRVQDIGDRPTLVKLNSKVVDSPVR